MTEPYTGSYGPTVPNNADAEQAVLAACLLNPRAYTRARTLLSDDDFYQPRHGLIWKAMRVLADRGEPHDAVTVAAELTRVGASNRLGHEGLAYLHTLVSQHVTTGALDYHAVLISEAAVRRRIIEAAHRMAQRAYETEASPRELIDAAMAEVEVAARLSRQDGAIPGLLGWHEFYDQHANKPNSWVVPGAIGRKDVWMVLSPPGAGKTMLSRQIAWAIAAGRHPFRLDQGIDPARTLLVDLENDEGMAADETIDYFGRIDALGVGTDGRGFTWNRPQGINLRNADHRALLDDVLGEVKPDIVLLGSVYKSFARTGEWDVAVGEARDAFDYLRVKHQCALWLEHHMPKAPEGGRRRTPLGSYIWEAWPSHGRVLERTADHKDAPFSFTSPFRGDRGQRDCPVGFTRGGRYPWDAIYDQDHLDYLTEQCAA